MSSEISIKINLDDFPMLKSFKKKDLEKTINSIILTGYKIYFPNIEDNTKNIELKEISIKMDNLKSQIEESNLIGLYKRK